MVDPVLKQLIDGHRSTMEDDVRVKQSAAPQTRLNGRSTEQRGLRRARHEPAELAVILTNLKEHIGTGDARVDWKTRTNRSSTLALYGARRRAPNSPRTGRPISLFLG